MDETAVLNLLLHGNQLKRTARTGWSRRGVVNPESVAAHSFGVAFTALVLVELIDAALDREKVLIMAIIHDLPEGLTTDIPTPAWRYMPTGIKTEVERSALADILDGVVFADELQSIWEELHASQTLEAHLVHDADKLEMFLQALIYEQQTGNRQLEEFWTIAHRFHFAEVQALYARLRARHYGAGLEQN